MPNSQNESPVRYERQVFPSFFDYLRKEKEIVYRVVNPNSIQKGSLGDNKKNQSRYLEGIKKGDSIVFRVDSQRLKELGAKAVEYEGELERVVDRIEPKGDTWYIHLK